MFQLEVGYGCRKVEANQALNRMEANQALNRVEANQVLNRVEGRQHHSLGFCRVTLWEFQPHLRRQEHR